MPVAKLTCPKCKSVLKPAKPLPSGKTVKCPKCGNVFQVPAEEIQEAIPILAEEPPSQPTPGKKHYTEDEEDTGPATYSFIDEPQKPTQRDDDDEEEEDYDERADISIVPDLTVKDPRGIAQEQIIRPSNWLMLMAVLDIVGVLIWMAWVLIPIFFSLPPDTSVQSNQPVSAKGKETAAKSFDWQAPSTGLANWLTALLTFAIGGFYLAYNCAIVLGAVKMQNLESYGMCIAACILAMIPISFCCYLFRLLCGIICLITLKNPAVVAGFEYRGEH